MKATNLYLLACAMTGLAVLGCRDVNEPSGPRPPGMEARPARRPPSRPDLFAVDQFALTMDVKGTLKPGTPIQIRATARALLRSRDARLQIVVPEAASVRLAKKLGHPGRMPVGVPLPVEGRTRQGMGQGAQVQQHAQVVFDQPGYYRVMAIAEDVSGDKPVANGQMVRNLAAKELWLLVTPTGGQVTRDFNPTLIPSGVPTQSGPFGEIVPNATCGESCPPPCTGCGCGGCVNNYVIFEAITHFTDGGTIINQPLKMATIGIERSTGDIVGVTDSQGRFRVNSCPAYPSTWRVIVYNHNSDVKVAPRVEFATTRAVVANINSTSCGKVVQFVSGMPESYVFVNAAMAAANGKVFFGRNRPQVQYWLHHESGNADYSWWSDDIEMYINDYLGSRGIFVAAHEYGHAFHEKALGGNYGGCGGDPHSFELESSFPCAYSEGFGNYYAATTLGPATGYYYNQIESPATFAQGGASEQAVAATYFDITDPAGGTGPEAAWDGIQYPGSYIAQLVQTCEELSTFPSGTGWARARGIDAFVYCMERVVDPEMRSAHFMEGNSRFVWDFREGATEPGGATQASDIRRLWLHNLYMQ
jgi:hypothetical protein